MIAGRYTYRSGERLIDAATGAVKHYRDRSDRVQFAGIFAPPGAPAWALGGLLDAIAQEVHGRASFACARITADFAACIAAARKELPRDQVVTAVMALQQARREVVKAVHETAARDVQGRQQEARRMVRQSRMCLNLAISLPN